MLSVVLLLLLFLCCNNALALIYSALMSIGIKWCIQMTRGVICKGTGVQIGIPILLLWTKVERSLHPFYSIISRTDVLLK